MIVNNALTRWLARRLTARVERIVTTREPDFVIGGANPYLQRWYFLPRNRLGNIYLHRFLRDDDDRALHDHPWVSVSLCVGDLPLGEVYLSSARIEERRTIYPGDLVFRSARFAHRLIVPEPGALTLFVTGPRIREWGFLCPNGWRHWKEFTAADDAGAVGRGCE